MTTQDRPTGAPPQTPRTSRHAGRVGAWGTASRAAAGVGLLTWALAVPHTQPVLGLPGAGSRVWGTVAGLLLVPGVLTALVAVRGRHAPPLRLGGVSALAVTVGLALVMQVLPVTVLVFVGATLLMLAVRGEGGCEVLAVPNLVLGRSDYLVCLPFATIDGWESARQDRRASDRPAGGRR